MISRGLTIVLGVTLSAVSVGCAAQTLHTPSDSSDRTSLASGAQNTEDSEAVVRAAEACLAFANAKSARDWNQVWSLTADVRRLLVVQAGRRDAERSDSFAQAQGFHSSDEVRGLSDRDFFLQNRAHLADRDQYVYKPNVTVTATRVGPVRVIPFAQKRIRVYPVDVTLSDGTVDRLAATLENDSWRVLEP